MKKSLLALAALAALSLVFVSCGGGDDPAVSTNVTPAGGEEQPTGGEEQPTETVEPEYLSITNDYDLGSGWKSSYDGATKTITWDEDYAGRGWWFGEKDASKFSKFTVVFSNATGADKWLKAVVQYDDETMSDKDGVFNEDGFSLTVELDAAKKSKIKQIYIQGKAAGNTATIKEAYFN